MSTTASDVPQTPPLLKPKPQRPFSSSSPALSSAPSTPDLRPAPDMARTRSILNLTSSALLGIYGPTASEGFRDLSTPPTPWGTGAETPLLHGGRETPIRGEEWGRYGLEGREAREGDLDVVGTFGGGGNRRRRESVAAATATATKYRAPHISVGWGKLFRRGLVLFGCGVCYGALVQRLHDNKRISIAPVEVKGIDRAGWAYLVFWGLAGVGMGCALPWVDDLWERGGCEEEVNDQLDEGGGGGDRKRGLGRVEWSDVVRGVGAFVGVAFAIRKLAWSSTLQLSLTLTLANPVLWYLLDRTSTGFTLSGAIGFFGTLILFFVNPSVIPAPTRSSPSTSTTIFGLLGGDGKLGRLDGVRGSLQAMLNSENVGVVTWIASVLFCSCVCFGNIGRLLVKEQTRVSRLEAM